MLVQQMHCLQGTTPKSRHSVSKGFVFAGPNLYVDVAWKPGKIRQHQRQAFVSTLPSWSKIPA
jgi:hypothetical protein